MRSRLARPELSLLSSCVVDGGPIDAELSFLSLSSHASTTTLFYSLWPVCELEGESFLPLDWWHWMTAKLALKAKQPLEILKSNSRRKGGILILRWLLPERRVLDCTLQDRYFTHETDRNVIMLMIFTFLGNSAIKLRGSLAEEEEAKVCILDRRTRSIALICRDLARQNSTSVVFSHRLHNCSRTSEDADDDESVE